MLAMKDIFMSEPTTAGLLWELRQRKSAIRAGEGRNGRARGSSCRQEGRQALQWEAE
jgi:hypothetical protein